MFRKAVVAAGALVALVLEAGGILSAAGSLEPAAAAEDGHAPMDVLVQQRIRVRDGTVLAATVWKPAVAQARPVPAVLVVTPYVSDEAHGRARRYVDRGYAMVSLDTRGRGNSGGTHQLFTDAGPDACAVIRWIRGQPWSDGRVAMRGGSYRGMTQWMTARTCPDQLVTIMPTASAYPGEDFPGSGPHGIFSYAVRWLALTRGRTANHALFEDDRYWERKFAEAFRRYVPFARLDRFVGAPSAQFQAWVAGLGERPDYSQVTPTPAQYRAITMPVLTVTGHYDGDQPGALRYYREHVAAAPPAAAAEHYLVMGPWDHADTRTPDRELGSSGAVRFGENSVLDMDAFHLDWLDWRFGRGPRPALLRDRVNWYVGGADQWRHSPSLDAVEARRLTLFLDGRQYEAYEGFRSGQLAPAPAAESAVHTMRSDPLDTTALDVTDTHYFDMVAGGEIDDPSPGYLSQTLTFHSARLEAPLTVAGQLRLTLYLAMDTPDADLVAHVFAVLPGGTVRLLGSDVVRARFRHGAPQPVVPGVVEPYVFDRFRWQAWALPAGAQLRLTVAPLNDPTMQKNFNSGGRPGYETREDARVATIMLHHDAEYPSRLEVPVADPVAPAS